ncbi:MAG TPA: hypothetical protein VD866_26890 [Urbifossiella sp.]|nr:hypothetical protein [Urbifossiella sp.]
MTRVTTVAVALLTAGVSWGQPPGVPGGQPGGPPPGFGPGGPGPVVKADPQVEAWVKTLTDKMNDPHDAIRESARAALVAVGSPALPALRQMVGGNDAKAFTARRLVQQIERAGFPGPGGGGFTGGGFGVPGGFGGPSPFPGQPGQPPMGPPAGRPGTERVPDNQPPLRGALDELKLDDKQRVQVEKAVEGYSTKLRGLLEGVRGGKLDRNELREAVTKLADEATAELNRALTAEQRAILERLTPRGRSLFPTPFAEATPGRPEGREPNNPERPRTPRPNPDGGR